MFNFEVGTSYTFEFYAKSLMGTGMTNAKLLGIADFGVANLISNVATTHAKALAYLPVNTPQDPSQLTYLIFESSTGVRTVAAYVWMVESSIAIAARKSLTITVSDAGADDAPRLKEILVLAGYPQTSVVINN